MVYLLTTESPFNENATSKRITCYLKALQYVGVDCLWLARRQNNIYGHPRKGYNEGIEYRIIGGTCMLNNRIKRLLFCFYNDVIVMLFLLFRLKSCDTLFIYFKNNSLKLSLCFITKLKRARILTELCEIPFFGSTSCKDVIGRKIYEKFIINKFDGIVTISDALTEYAHLFAQKKCVIQKVPILVEYDKYDLADKSFEAEIPYILHVGTLTERKDGILGMIEAFGKTCQHIDGPFRFICSGNKEDSPHAKEIDELILKYNLSTRLVFAGRLRYSEVRDYLQKASIVIINKYPTEQNKYGFSTKLGEYMAAGKAIIITNFGEATNWLNNGENSIIVPVQDNDALANAVLRLYYDDGLRNKLGENAKKTCQNSFDYRLWGTSLKDMF